jgi:hypothetical protein
LDTAMMDLQRKRLPEDVPTPVAVAVSDYCRRAKVPASPGLVRDALALLEEADDGRVRELADTEPTAKLGPFAVVDVILGTRTSVAAEREMSGYYDEVRRATRGQRPKSEATELPVLTTSKPAAAAPKPAPSAPSAPRERKARAQSLTEKIAPHKRRPGEFDREERPAPKAGGASFLTKRNLPAPRGRFTTVDPSRANFETLFRPEGKETVAALIEQVPHRIALLRTLEQGYVSKRGEDLSVGDVEDVLEEHALFELIEKKERDGALSALIDAKGALSRASYAFGLTTEELEKLIVALGITAEVEQVRDRYIKEALSAENLKLRLDLLFRGKYLEDLGIERKFQQTLTRELEILINEVKDAATSAPTLVDLLSRQHALHAESLRRALEKLGLLEPWLKDKQDKKDKR